jgi:hypothetical protein
MKKWLQRNLNNIIVTSFLIPILLVAFVSISHVTTFYGLSNPFSWAIYLSVAVEIAALAALAGISAKFGRFIYIPFGIVTIIQFVGNFFYSYSFIDPTSVEFMNWVDMISGIFEPMGVEPDNYVAHRRILAFLTGGMIPFISLTFAHMLIVYSSRTSIGSAMENPVDEVPTQDISNEESQILSEEELIEISRQVGKQEAEETPEKINPTEEDLQQIQTLLESLVPIQEEQPAEKKRLSYTKNA